MKELRYAEMFASHDQSVNGFTQAKATEHLAHVNFRATNWARAYEIRVTPSDFHYGLDLVLEYGEVVPDSSKAGSGTPKMKRIATFHNSEQKEMLSTTSTVNDRLLSLVIELRAALALERGGGSPLSTEEYLKLDKRAREVT